VAGRSVALSLIVAFAWLVITRDWNVFGLTTVVSVIANFREQRLKEAMLRAMLVGVTAAVGNLYLHPLH
jgi:hypothetical protein